MLRFEHKYEQELSLMINPYDQIMTI